LQVSVQLLLTQKPKPFSESSETLKHRLEAANAKKHKFIAKTHASLQSCRQSRNQNPL
jgi:hypothetical protein